MTTDISTIEQELTAALEKAVPHITTAYSTTLEDVLRALPRTEVIDVQLHHDCSGQWLLCRPRKIGVMWLLGKPLSEQKEYVKHFLHSLLCQ